MKEIDSNCDGFSLFDSCECPRASDGESPHQIWTHYNPEFTSLDAALERHFNRVRNKFGEGVNWYIIAKNTGYADITATHGRNTIHTMTYDHEIYERIYR